RPRADQARHQGQVHAEAGCRRGGSLRGVRTGRREAGRKRIGAARRRRRPCRGGGKEEWSREGEGSKVHGSPHDQKTVRIASGCRRFVVLSRVMPYAALSEKPFTLPRPLSPSPTRPPTPPPPP